MWLAARTFARALRRERERPGGAALLEEQEQVLAVNAQQVAAAASSRNLFHNNLQVLNDPIATPAVAAAPHSNNEVSSSMAPAQETPLARRSRAKADARSATASTKRRELLIIVVAITNE